MDHIDVSEIKHKTTSFFTPSKGSEKLKRYLSQCDHLKHQIVSLEQVAHFEISDSSSSTRRHTLFKPFQGLQTSTNQETLSLELHHPSFKVPTVNTYYTQHANKNILPDRLCRTSSIIQTPINEKTSDFPVPLQVKAKQPAKEHSYWQYIILLMALIIFFIAFFL